MRFLPEIPDIYSIFQILTRDFTRDFLEKSRRVFCFEKQNPGMSSKKPGECFALKNKNPGECFALKMSYLMICISKQKHFRCQFKHVMASSSKSKKT